MPPSSAIEILLKSLYIPEYSRPSFLLIEQRKTEWPKHVFLTNLSEGVQYFIEHLELMRRSMRAKKITDPLIPLELRFAIEGRPWQIITSKTISGWRIAIEHAWRLDNSPPSYSALQHVNFGDFSIAFINRQYNRQLQPKGEFPDTPGVKTKKDLIPVVRISPVLRLSFQVPLFQFDTYKLAINELLLQARHTHSIKTIVRPTCLLASENVKLWNDQLSIILEDRLTYEKQNYRFLDFTAIKIDDTLTSWLINSQHEDVDDYQAFHLQTLAKYSAEMVNFLIDTVFDGKMPQQTPVSTYDTKSVITTLEELFFNPEHIEPCLQMLRDVDPAIMVGDSVAKYKTGIGIWFNQLLRANLIRFVKYSEYDRLLKDRIENLLVTDGSLYAKVNGSKAEKVKNYEKQFRAMINKMQGK